MPPTTPEPEPVQLSPADQVRTMTKVWARILPLLFVLFVVAFVDRINIGFASLTMNRELGMSSQQYGLVAAIFFAGYVLFEIPSNLLLDRVGARIWIGRILITWGIVAALTGLVRNVTEFCGARFLLGLAEAGFFPGIILYLTYWFRRQEQARAIGFFMTGLPVASMIGAPLSGLILDHIHWLGISSWRWLLILEGLPAIACGIFTFVMLPNRPAEAAFLSDQEKGWLGEELARERESIPASANQPSGLSALRDGRVWHMALTVFLWDMGLYWIGFYMPQFIKSLSALYSNTTIGLLTAIPQAAGLAALVAVSMSSDRWGERRWHAAIPIFTGAAALFYLTTVHSPVAALATLAVAVAGVYSFMGPFYSIPSEFLTGARAAAGIALINSVANTGAFVGTYIVGAINQRTAGPRGGMLFAGGALLLSATVCSLLPVGRAKRSGR